MLVRKPVPDESQEEACQKALEQNPVYSKDGNKKAKARIAAVRFQHPDFFDPQFNNTSPMQSQLMRNLSLCMAAQKGWVLEGLKNEEPRDREIWTSGVAELQESRSSSSRSLAVVCNSNTGADLRSGQPAAHRADSAEEDASGERGSGIDRGCSIKSCRKHQESLHRLIWISGDWNFSDGVTKIYWQEMASRSTSRTTFGSRIMTQALCAQREESSTHRTTCSEADAGDPGLHDPARAQAARGTHRRVTCDKTQENSEPVRQLK